jgi:hypothetical protein
LAHSKKKDHPDFEKVEKEKVEKSKATPTIKKTL